MASINLGPVLAKVDDWKESDKGRKRMKKTLDNYVRNNVGKTQAGSPVLTRKSMIDYGNKLIQAIQNTALSCDLPDSVASHFSSLKRGKTIILPDGSYVMEIAFTDDLTRESLEPQRYGGVRNIVADAPKRFPMSMVGGMAITFTLWALGRDCTSCRPLSMILIKPMVPNLGFMLLLEKSTVSK